MRYEAERGLPRDVTALQEHALVGASELLADTPHVRWFRRAVPGLHYVVAANTTAAQTQACLEGLGIALLPRFVARRHPELVSVLPSLAPPARTAYAVVHATLRRNARIAAVLAWLPLAFASAR